LAGSRFGKRSGVTGLNLALEAVARFPADRLRDRLAKEQAMTKRGWPSAPHARGVDLCPGGGVA
jgi:hypothetical protein